MTELTNSDISTLVEVMEYYITTREQELIEANAGDREWNQLTPYRQTLQNLYFLATTYGKEQEIQCDWTSYAGVNWKALDEMDNWDNQWNEFWNEIEAYAQHHRVPTRYIEEEFLIDGEFVSIDITYMHELDDGEYPERNE